MPTPWSTTATIEELCQISSGTTPPRSQFDRYFKNGTIHWVKTLDLNNSEIVETDESVTPAALQETSLTVYQPGTVMVAMYGGFNQIGRTGLLRVPAAVNQAITAIQPHADKLCPEFLLSFLNFKVDYWKTVASSSRKDPNITSYDVRAFPLVCPPLAEQRAIAAALSDVDALLAKLDQLIVKKRDLKQAAMQQLLTGQTRLPGFTAVWSEKSIEELEQLKLVRLARGEVISQRDIDEVPGDYPIYSSSVKAGGLFGRYGRYMFNEELITWSVDGGGHFFYRPFHRFSVTNVCGYMRLNTSKLDYRFIASQLQLLHSRMKFDYQDKAHPSIIRKAYKLWIPPPDEQIFIASVLSDMDAELAALESRRDKTRQLKQGMMQELLTGRIRLV